MRVCPMRLFDPSLPIRRGIISAEDDCVLRAGGKWLELFEEVTLEEAMRDSLLYAKPGEPSLVVQLHASKKLAQEQCQELAQEKDGLSASNKDLKDKVLRLQVRTEEVA